MVVRLTIYENHSRKRDQLKRTESHKRTSPRHTAIL